MRLEASLNAHTTLQRPNAGECNMLKWLKRAGLMVLALSAIALLAAIWLLRGSLPELEGEAALAGLAAPATIQRDALGVVTIDAASQADAMRALGYVHAQERYFEMDLMRRTAAGELAELFGPVAVDIDRQHRMHRMRARVMADLDAFANGQQAILQAYTDGANAGLADLKVRPWPYLLLRQSPRRWEPADSALAGYAMYFDLQDARNSRELALWKIRQAVPPALYRLLAHDGSAWDAPLSGPARGDAALPTADELDLRKLASVAAASGLQEADVPGSNNFAVAGALTADGRAIVADDMHLGLRAPNVWFRARLRYPDAAAPGGRVDVSGFTLPGLPAVIVGSNGHVAWGFTNSYIDTADFAYLPAIGPDAGDGHAEHPETIQVAGAAPERITVQESAWGPILQQNEDGSALALRWTAHLPGAIGLAFSGLASAGSLDEALSVADRIGMPAQNLVIGDSQGRIAWRLIGGRPGRSNGCRPEEIANAPVAAASAGLPPPSPPTDQRHDPCDSWNASFDHAPAVIDPADGRVWTANSRVVDDAVLARVGDGGYDLGARAQQIRDGLFARERFSEADLLAVQLDDRALFLERWYRLLRQVVENSQDPALQRIEAASRTWEGRAVTASASYRLARGFRGHVLDAAYAGLIAPARAALGEDFIEPKLPQFEGVLWPLVSERPAHLLSPQYESWEALLVEAAQKLEAELSEQGPELGERSWGERNTAAICHPLAGAVPLLGKRWLCMPPDPLPGDNNMPRVQGPKFGASQRMVVAPGHEADGIAHMPGGQSGHPLSPFWGAGHDDWVQGRPTPFLPGEAVHSLTLRPATAQPR